MIEVIKKGKAVAGNVLALAALITIMFLLKLDIAVQAQGIIQAENNNIKIDHPSGGRIENLYVTEGQEVSRGELLAVIDNSYISESFQKYGSLVELLRIRKERLEAEIHGHDFEKKKDFDAAVYLQEKLSYSIEIQKLNESIEISSAAERQKMAELEAKKIRVEGLQKQLDIDRRQMELIQKLSQSKAVAESIELDKKNAYQKTRNALLNETEELKIAEAEIEKSRLNTRKIRSDFISARQKELEELNDRLTEVRSEFSGANIRKTQERIYSPVSGVIQKIVKNHTGSVIPQGGEILEISPTEVPLIAVVRLDPRDRSKIWPGLNASLEMNGSHAPFKNLKGKVRLISEDVIKKENNDNYYKVDIELPDIDRKKTFPGMSVSAYIKTGKRSIAEYILWPLVRQEKYVFSE